MPITVSEPDLTTLSGVATGFEKLQIPVIDVLDTREAAFLGEASEINNRYDFYLALADLMRQVGWSHQGGDMVNLLQERLSCVRNGEYLYEFDVCRRSFVVDRID